MSSDTIRLYNSAASPNCRRVRMFLAEKGVDVTIVPVDLGQGEQHSEAYRTINPRRVVPALVLDDGSAIGEVPAIFRYFEETTPDPPLLGTGAAGKARVVMWERRVELEGFAAVMEGVRNSVARLKDRAIAGAHDYEQIPALVDRSRRRVANFHADFDTVLMDAPFIAGEAFSAADITMLVTLDFATRAFDMPIPPGCGAIRRWYDRVASRPSAAA
jgi:glutathione S-transferase